MNTMIEAVIFDMDGLLIDSERLWQEAETTTFQSLGAPITKELLKETVGMREDELITYWHNKFPWTGKTITEVEEEIKAKVLQLIKEKGQPKSGVKYILDFFKKKNLKIALASSTYLSFIIAVVEKFDIKEYFDELYSAEFEKYGKPHPSVYLVTAEMLKVEPHKCLAFEDSLNGVLSAKAAKMKCVCVPDALTNIPPQFAIADKIISSLEEFNEETWNSLQ